MTLPMLRVLPHPWDFVKMSAPVRHGGVESEDSGKDKYDPLRKLSMVQVQPPRNPNKPFTSFRINDILSERSKNAHKNGSNPDGKLNGLHHAHRRESLSKLDTHHLARTAMAAAHHNIERPGGGAGHGVSVAGIHNHNHGSNPAMRQRMPLVAPTRIVRPWDTSPSTGRNSEASSEADDEEINVDEDEDSEPSSTPNIKGGVSPLDALMDLANKTFQGLETSEAADAKRREQAAMFGKHSNPKKRRKSRTAFTNQQIYELEKRFLYQKYLTPADRDEIAQHLGLTNAQVITWFQNRRAKLKRDLEELKNDVVATKHLSTPEPGSVERESISSDCEYGLSGAEHSPSKRCRSESRTPEPNTHSCSPKLAETAEDDRCHSPEEIIVDDKDELPETRT